MATKSGQQEPEKGEVIEEMLDALDTTLDRVKVLYEQYFLGIQKQPPTYLHTDIERKIRDLAQIQIRNTAHRYRFATLQQKFGAYNSYWRRTLRQIENGTYIRNLSKISRQAARSGADVPEEILAAMPKRMREQVRRDREAALARAKLREVPAQADDELLTLAEDDVEVDLDGTDAASLIDESTAPRRAAPDNGAHRIDEDDEFDIDAYFASVTTDSPAAGQPAAAAANDDAGRPTTGQPRLPKPPVGPVAAPSTLPTAPTQALPRPPVGRPSTAISPLAAAAAANDSVAGAPPAVPAVPVPPIPARLPTAAIPAVPRPPSSLAAQLASTTPTSSLAPSQATRPLPIAAGAAAAQAPSAVESMNGPFPRLPNLPPLPNAPLPSIPRPAEAEPAIAAGARAQLITPDGVPPEGLAMRVRTPPLSPPGSAAAGKHARPGMERTFMAPIERTRPPADPAAPERIAPERTPLPTRAAAEPPSEFPDDKTERASVVRPLPAPPPSRAGVSRVERLPTEYLSNIDSRAEKSAARPLPAPAPPRPPRTPPHGRAVTARPPSELPDDLTEPNPLEIPQPPSRSAAPRTPPFSRATTEQPDELPPPPRVAPRPPRPEPRQPQSGTPSRPPPGMSDADVNALYAKYVQAKQTLGEDAGPNAYGKLLQTINAQAPKIMQQYKSKGVDFSVVVKDNQVIIRAKPKP